MFLSAIMLLCCSRYCGSFGIPQVARWCATSSNELIGCKLLSDAVSTSPDNFTMNLTCTEGENTSHCMQMIHDHQADLTLLDARDIHMIDKNIQEQRAILGQDHGEGTGRSYYVVAVVRKDSTLTLQTLKGARSCHTGITTMAGWTVPVSYLLRQDIIQWNKHCDPYTMVGDFFTASCIPGVLSVNHHNQDAPPKKLCALCKNQDLCLNEHRTQQAGALNALQYLSDGTADVAFVRHIDVFRDTEKDGVSNPNDLRILCGDGQRKGMGAFESCHLAKIPTPVIIARANNTKVGNKRKSAGNETIDIASGGDEEHSEAAYFKRFLLKLQERFNSNSELSASLALFRDSTVRLVEIKNISAWNPWLGQEYLNITSALRECDINTLAYSRAAQKRSLLYLHILFHVTNFLSWLNL